MGCVGHVGHAGHGNAQLAARGRHGTGLVCTSVGGAPSRGRFGCEGSSMAQSSVAAGVAAGGEGSGARSMTLSF